MNIPSLSVWFALAMPAMVGADAGGTRLDDFLDGLKSLKSGFTQSIYDEQRNLVEASSGTLFIARPGRFRWDYLEPYPQAIVGDGERVWIYDSELAQVTVQPFDDALDSTPAALLTSDRPLGESFEITDLGAQGRLAWIELTPKAPDATFSSIRVGFAGAALDTMEMVDNFGQLMRLEFSALSRNPVLDPALFQFTPPDGVDVFETGRK